MAMHPVAALDGADAGRGARHDHVAGSELEQAGQIGNHFRHFPDQLVEIPLLAHLAIDLEPDGTPLGMTDFSRARQRRAWRRLLEGLADLPGPSMLLALGLKVPSRHVEADAIAENAR